MYADCGWVDWYQFRAKPKRGRKGTLICPSAIKNHKLTHHKESESEESDSKEEEELEEEIEEEID
jgi:hypothetical protein